MALWSIKPTWKKSIREVMYFYKEEKCITIETGWRWGEFTCETENDETPVINEGVDLFSQGYDIEMQECTDGCWVEYDFDEFTEEEEEQMRAWLDENSFFDLEEDGWILSDTEFIMDCEPEITRIEK
jgi:hypothetical protein